MEIGRVHVLTCRVQDRHSVGKKGSAYPLLVCSIVLASMLLFLSHFPVVHATAKAAVLQVSPATSAYPRQIKVIGSNYGALEKVQVYWDYTGPGTGTLERTATTNSSGAFTVLFYVPLTSTGTYTIGGIGMSSGLIASATFDLLPGMPVTPVAGIAGTQLTLSGNAFGADENVNLYWNYNTISKTGTLLTIVVADDTGSFTYVFNAPVWNTGQAYYDCGNWSNQPDSGFDYLHGLSADTSTCSCARL